MTAAMLQWLIFAAGLGQLALVAGSLAIPRILGWREETQKLRPLTRQVFWTYAAYIWTTNLAFGLVSALAPGALSDGSTLSAAVTGFIALYWGSRLAIQFLVFDRGDAPSGPFFRIAEGALVVLFVALTAIYAGAAVWNLHLLRT
jgi:hypothetical protein